MFNKPIGCVTALQDKQYKTVMSYINIKERIFPVGRLDYNTSGLLLLTNDGDFANKVMHPSNEINKTYLVQLQRPILNRQINLIEEGIKIEGRKTSKAKIKKLGPALLEITIHEGRNRIVRKLFEKLELKVVNLQRIKVGSLRLGNLKLGTYKHLTKKDLEKVFK
jgi:23S rRNA pseudouridine2605 synthase